MIPSTSDTPAVAVVTGAWRGIGRAVAEALLADGMAVVLNDINAEGLAQTVAELGPRARGVAGDMSRKADVERLMAGALAGFGRIDVLVNNAGGDRAISILDLDEEEWDRLLAINLKSVYLCSRAVLPGMIARGHGRIINMSSITGRQGAINGGIHYATCKAGVLGFTRTLARQMAPHGITVNALAPGIIDTVLIQENVSAERLPQLLAQVPAQRLGQTWEVAKAAAFLASPAAGYITGATLDINGGLWIG